MEVPGEEDGQNDRKTRMQIQRSTAGFYWASWTLLNNIHIQVYDRLVQPPIREDRLSQLDSPQTTPGRIGPQRLVDDFFNKRDASTRYSQQLRTTHVVPHIET